MVTGSEKRKGDVKAGGDGDGDGTSIIGGGINASGIE